MRTIEMTETHVIELLEKGTLDLGFCVLINIDRKVDKHVSE